MKGRTQSITPDFIISKSQVLSCFDFEQSEVSFTKEMFVLTDDKLVL